jgi:hypothetical protein
MGDDVARQRTKAKTMLNTKALTNNFFRNFMMNPP